MIAKLKAWALWALFSIGAVLFALVKGRRDVRTEVDSKAVGAADKQLRDEWMRED